jgi:hypothetical protein
MVGGVGGSIVGSESAVAALSLFKGDSLAAVGRLFNSPEFIDAAMEAAQTGRISEATATKL